MKWLLQRLSEPSTWAGLATLALGSPQLFTGLLAHNVSATAIAAAVTGVGAVLAPEKGSTGA